MLIELPPNPSFHSGFNQSPVLVGSDPLKVLPSSALGSQAIQSCGAVNLAKVAAPSTAPWTPPARLAPLLGDPWVPAWVTKVPVSVSLAVYDQVSIATFSVCRAAGGWAHTCTVRVTVSRAQTSGVPCPWSGRFTRWLVTVLQSGGGVAPATVGQARAAPASPRVRASADASRLIGPILVVPPYCGVSIDR